MRILFQDHTLPQLLKDADLPVGGWAVQLRELLIALAKAGHQSGVLTWKYANAFVGPQSVCDLLETYDRNSGIPKLRLLTHQLPATYRQAKAFRPDIVLQSCSGMDTAIMANVAASLQVPFVHRLACDTDADGRHASYLSRLERWAFHYGLARADMVICQNDYQLYAMRQRFPQKRLLLLPNAIDVTPQLLSRNRAARSYISWLATFRYQKNLPLLYRIASRLPHIAFKVGGALPPAPDQESIDALAALKTLPNVELPGLIRRSGIQSFLSGSVALLSTSRYEGFSNTFLEAFAAGTPVIACRDIDPSGIIAREGLGMVADDEEQLARRVEQLWNMRETDYAEISRRCRHHVEIHHTPSSAVHSLAKAIASLALRQGHLSPVA